MAGRRRASHTRDAGGVDVTSGADASASHLLRRHVGGRSQRYACGGHAFIADCACDPKVGDFDAAEIVHDDVGGLDVSRDGSAQPVVHALVNGPHASRCNTRHENVAAVENALGAQRGRHLALANRLQGGGPACSLSRPHRFGAGRVLAG